MSQFLNPRTNVRTDDSGGPIENRARFLFEIIEAVGESLWPATRCSGTSGSSIRAPSSRTSGSISTGATHF
ncbi:hypothetical protein [Streptomyces sp. NBC_01525]|uniref:oxidoreductase n=1 Tax=Streptomyces sp. NBC_01525 TaxID=2903893 RepID=UPI0038699B6C